MLILNCFQMSEDYNVIGSERQFADRLPVRTRILSLSSSVKSHTSVRMPSSLKSRVAIF